MTQPTNEPSATPEPTADTTPAPPAPDPETAAIGKFPEKYQRDTLEATVQAMNEGLANANKLIGKKPDDRLDLSGQGPIKSADDVAAMLNTSIDDLVDHYRQHGGKLSDEVRQQIDASGRIGADLVQQLVDGAHRTREAARVDNARLYQDAIHQVGGEQDAQAEIAWANANLTESERSAFDGMIRDRDGNFLPTAGAALLAIQAKRVASMGPTTSPARTQGSAPSATYESFKTHREAREFMKQADFTTNPAKQQEYFARMAKLNGTS